MNHAATPAPFRPNLGSALFLAVMLGAAAATMLRMVVAAGLLPVADFGTYATIAATGAFLASILSFGSIETTIKNFPRMVGSGRGAELLPEAHRILRRLILRAILCGGPVYIAGALLDVEWLRLGGLSFFFALSTAYSLLLASMQRAAGTSATLAAGTTLRSVSVFAAVAIAAHWGNVTIVLIAEMGTSVAACLLSELLFFRRGKLTENAKDMAPLSDGSGKDGLILFFANSLISMPFYLDRLFVTSVMGVVEGGRYAALALFLVAASLIVNTLAQRVGPETIRLVQKDSTYRAASKLILLWSSVASIVWLAMIGVAAAIIKSGLLPVGFDRYRIDPELLVPIAVSGVLLNTGMLEFLLIALDRERQMLRAAVIFTLAVAAAALAVACFGLGLPEFLWLIAAARLSYLFTLLAGLPLRRDEFRGA